MNPLKKGPQIKMPAKLSELKAPAFAADVYHDLRDRHLLPLVALLLVAIVAVPILLSESGGSEEGAGTNGPSVASASSKVSPARQIVVSRSTPKLRSYHERLAHRTPTNPFRQLYTNGSGGEGGSSSGEGEGEGSSGSGEGEGEVTVTHEEETTITEHHELKYFTYTIDVQIVPVSVKGVPSTAKPTVRQRVPELTSLPARQVPALTFMEPAADAKRAVMLVSDGVKSVVGDNPCISGTETCQLLALEPGVPETIVYGGSERTYRIKLLKVNFEETNKLIKAPVKKPHAG